MKKYMFSFQVYSDSKENAVKQVFYETTPDDIMLAADFEDYFSCKESELDNYDVIELERMGLRADGTQIK